MYNICKLLISAALLLAPVDGSIELEYYEADESLSATTIELLSTFNHCVVFIFDWTFDDDYEYDLTSTNYFLFYSDTYIGSLIVETYMQYRQKSLWNPRFDTYAPHPLFTKHTTNLINLYSSAATSTDRYRVPKTNKLWRIASRYNVPFNYVLIFMSNERFNSVDNVGMLYMFTMVSAPAVYILILDEQEVYVVGFAQVLHSAPYLHKVSVLQETHIQLLHELVHKDLEKLKLSIYGENKFSMIPHCEFGHPVLGHPNDCALKALMKNYNSSYCSVPTTTCAWSAGLNFMHTQQLRSFYLFTNRSYMTNMEFINYLVDIQEISFTCIVQPGSMGLIAFVQAFDLSTWIVAGIAFVCLTLTVAAMSNRKGARWWTQLQPSAVLVLMLFFERFYASAQLNRAASRQSILVVTLWAFGAMLLGMSYSGNMISELAAPSLPAVPQDLHELSSVEYPVFTTKLVVIFSDYDDIEPTSGYLHSEIREYLRENPENAGTLTHDLKRLNKIMKLREFVSIVPEYQPSTTGRSQVLFAFADTRVEMKAIGLWSLMTDSRLLTSRGKKLPFFDRPWQLTVQTNFLLPTFRKFFAKIFESGASRYWEVGFEAELLKIQIFKLMLAQNSPVIAARWMRMTALATIWRSLDALKEVQASSTAMNMDNLSPAFQLLVFGLLVSALALINERWPLQVATIRILWMTHKALVATWRMVPIFSGYIRRPGKL